MDDSLAKLQTKLDEQSKLIQSLENQRNTDIQKLNGTLGGLVDDALAKLQAKLDDQNKLIQSLEKQRNSDMQNLSGTLDRRMDDALAKLQAKLDEQNISLQGLENQSKSLSQMLDELKNERAKFDAQPHQVTPSPPENTEQFQADNWFNRYFLPYWAGSYMVIGTPSLTMTQANSNISVLRRSNIEARKFWTDRDGYHIMYGAGLPADLADQMIKFLREHLNLQAQRDTRKPRELGNEAGTYTESY
jgi:hypothetical protein